VRDVHYTHYGRMCPIETPEGPNIGLISSLSTYAKVNEFGFIETPYRKVENGIVTANRVPDGRRRGPTLHIAPGQHPSTEDRQDPGRQLTVRSAATTRPWTPHEIDYMDVSPIQLVSPAAALIPFLEHDDANRALMGSNMQRQAVPLLRHRGAAGGHGLEGKVGRGFRRMLVARRSGVVEFVSRDDRVRNERDEERRRLQEQPNLDIYRLTKFRRSNQDTCINQRPRQGGPEGQAGEVLADGPATSEGRAGARPQRAGGVHAVGRVQLRGRHHHLRALSRRTSSPRSTSRSSRPKCATPSAARKRSPARSRT
jgi:DNA-directed RNA polymerase subunit beta